MQGGLEDYGTDSSTDGSHFRRLLCFSLLPEELHNRLRNGLTGFVCSTVVNRWSCLLSDCRPMRWKWVSRASPLKPLSSRMRSARIYSSDQSALAYLHVIVTVLGRAFSVRLEFKKRVHAAASNLGLLMRHRHGIGTPRSLQGLAATSMAPVGQAATAVYLSMFLGLARLVRLVSSIFGPTRPANRISPLRTVIQRKDPGTTKIGPRAISATG